MHVYNHNLSFLCFLFLYISCTYQASLTYSFSSLDLSNLDHGNHHFNKIWRMGAGNVTDYALHSAVHDRLNHVSSMMDGCWRPTNTLCRHGPGSCEFTYGQREGGDKNTRNKEW